LPGGFFSQDRLGKEEPRGFLDNRPLTNCKLIIDELGRRERFRELLARRAKARQSRCRGRGSAAGYGQDPAVRRERR
jgi:hypothetical protein